MLVPNFDMVEKYLELLSDEESEFTWQTFTDCKNSEAKNGVDVLAKTWHGSFYELKDELTKYNNLGAGVFICVNRTDLKGVSKKNIVKVRSYFAEADGEPIGEFKLAPTFVVHSANGKHYYFVLRQFTDSLELCEKIQASIAETHATDSSTKNVNRVLRVPGFYHQKNPSNPVLVRLEDITGDYYLESEIAEKYPVKAPGRPPKHSNTTGVGRGFLLPSVLDYFRKSWKETPGNANLVHAAANCKRNNYTLEECIEMFSAKGEDLNQNTLNQIKAIYRSADYTVNPFYGIKKELTPEELVWRGRLFRGVYQNSNIVHVVDEDSEKIYKMDYSIVSRILGKKNQDRVELVFSDYSPEVNSYKFSKDSCKYFNLYEPPEWRKSSYFKGIELQPYSTMPLEYEEFFNHLFGDYPESLEYVLNWIAYSLRNKNVTILALVGTARGIGKSSLASILKSLHGSSNFEVCKQAILGKEFNSQIVGKTLVNFDEVSILKESDLESIKAYTNHVAAIEGKGVDAKTAKIHASIILTNNNLDCLTGVKAVDDRQFSVPDITSVPINKNYFEQSKCGIQRIEQLWEDKELIDKLARWLWFRDLSKFDPTSNFKSAHYHEVVRNSQLEWHRFLLEEFRSKHYNCAIPFLQIKAVLRDKLGMSGGVGLNSFNKICNEHPDKIAIKHLERCPYVVFSKDGESKKDFLLRLDKFKVGNSEGFEILKLAKNLID